MRTIACEPCEARAKALRSRIEAQHRKVEDAEVALLRERGRLSELRLALNDVEGLAVSYAARGVYVCPAGDETAMAPAVHMRLLGARELI